MEVFNLYYIIKYVSKLIYEFNFFIVMCVKVLVVVVIIYLYKELMFNVCVRGEVKVLKM